MLLELITITATDNKTLPLRNKECEMMSLVTSQTTKHNLNVNHENCIPF